MRHHSHPATSPLTGTVRVPGDKSLSHRAVLFAAMAEGASALTGVLDAADVRSTLAAVDALGARVTVTSGRDGLDVDIVGWGSAGPREPDQPVDCGNSGTTARLLAGVLAGWAVPVQLVGDPSLSKRPMRRVTDPLARMGATFTMAEGGTLPLTTRGGALHGMRHELPVASAQVKTALLLAGLRAQGTTTVCEPAPSRDHTERLLPLFGVPVAREEVRCASVTGPRGPVATAFSVPADPSSAAFLVAAALLVPGSDVMLADVALNPTRIGFLQVLARMGARIEVTVTSAPAAVEPVGNIRVRHGAELRATTVTGDEVPSLVDEVPVLAVVATAATGTTRFEGVGELRVKESDRLAGVAGALSDLGAEVLATGDSLEITGPTPLRGGDADSLGDHRLAMAFAVAGLRASAPVVVDRFEAIHISYPRFLSDLRYLATGRAPA